MGSCSSLIRPSLTPLAGEDFTYPRFCSVQIKSKSKAEKEPIDFYLPDPSSLYCDFISLEKSEIFISETTLPGIDPRKDLNRNCQDLTLLLKSGKSFLMCVFDGHGKEGHRVSMFCSVFIQKYFTDEWVDDQSDPLQFLKKMIEQCEESLQNFSGHLDRVNSGA
jgi:hypothetical protein